ncbi:hypothetical protein [Candidatus Coxiella mudrowiae]|uniref:hypothetical protein n=1 Tax=Candidatus Coxiella mudrowiae TaxID=2054173 RepID=UPI000C28B204|nr:hypothetical protein [Candidatus Coxiella mudrowiae]
MVGIKKRVDFVATGKKLINGNTLQTNATHFVHTLIKNNIQTGQRIIVEDDQQEIKQAIHYLFSSHALP